MRGFKLIKQRKITMYTEPAVERIWRHIETGRYIKEIQGRDHHQWIALNKSHGEKFRVDSLAKWFWYIKKGLC